MESLIALFNAIPFTDRPWFLGTLSQVGTKIIIGKEPIQAKSKKIKSLLASALAQQKWQLRALRSPPWSELHQMVPCHIWKRPSATRIGG